MATQIYVAVDAGKCCGYRLCAEECPEVFKLDDGGFAYVDDPAVPPGLEERARRGAAACPEDAITVSDEPFAS
jgi:ferredoxin